MKLVILTNILAPYRIKLFEEINKLADELTVVVMASGHEDRSWQLPEYTFNVIELPGLHIKVPGNTHSIHINTHIFRTFNQLAPDAVISGGYAPANIFAFLYCKLKSVIHISWGELILEHNTERSLIRRLIRHWMIGKSDACIASSDATQRAFVHYGAKPETITTSVMPIDVHKYAKLAEKARKEVQQKLPRPTMLVVSRLIDLKGFYPLFEIFKNLSKSYPNATLYIAGEGSEKQNYEKHIQKEGLKNIHFLGHLNEEALSQFYANSDIFLFPTLMDPFGAVVSEALASKTLVISSVYAAATENLIEHGETGFRFDPKNIADAVEIINHVLSLPDARIDAIKSRGFEKVAEHDFPVAAREMVEFTRKVISSDYNKVNA